MAFSKMLMYLNLGFEQVILSSITLNTKIIDPVIYLDLNDMDQWLWLYFEIQSR